MNEELSKLIEDARRAGSDVAAFVQHHAPELANEIVKREIVLASVFGGFFLAVFALFLLLAIWRLSKDDSESAGNFFIVALLALAPVAINLHALITAVTAPRLVVVQKISELLR